jgi:hypothetical protein
VIDGRATEAVAFGHYQSVRDQMAAHLMPPVARSAQMTRDMQAMKQEFRAMSCAMRSELDAMQTEFEVALLRHGH